MLTALLVADARQLPLATASFDLVVTSPPYWRKRDYGHSAQIGQEPTPASFVSSIMDCLTEWRRVLRPSGSVFLNIGDTYCKRSLAGIPGLIEAAATRDRWRLRNRIIWAKTTGMPDPSRTRLANRHEYVLHLTPASAQRYHYDLVRYNELYGRPGDVWHIEPDRSSTSHLAPYPTELARRAILLGCPQQVCRVCGHVAERITTPSNELDPSRPQARRAMQLASQAGLTTDHLAAIRATGITDGGKTSAFQTGTNRNRADVQRLAAEAKAVLGGYFREFTMPLRITTGWTTCGHEVTRPGRVLDPFCGTGTTGVAAAAAGADYLGVDLVPLHHHNRDKLPSQRSVTAAAPIAGPA
ncbi:site-specific DNA-methyltransferase [Streptomyces sp. NPDC052179]|uniref:DNA-methyltransferase n=1 Tax=Streptomyces sp. NPDC052179 TaxID=3155680 RepID=UPI00342BF0E7